MNLGNHTSNDDSADLVVPPGDKRKLAAAAVLLAIPVVALLWVPSYARETPRLFGFPFFFWYQFAWVFVCAAMTWGAYLLVLSARRQPKQGTGDRR